MGLIKAKEIFKNYDKEKLNIEVLKNINVEIKEGEFIVILGPSGSGKTTLLNVLSGLDMPTKGNLYLFGQDYYNLKSNTKAFIRAHKIGFVFQSYNLISNLNTFENIAFLSSLGKQKGREEILNILKEVNLEKFEKYYPHELSGGMKQKVAIARALINDPKVIFADEPTGNLDSKSSLSIMKIFKSINKKRKTSILMVTHNESLCEHATRVIKIKDGEIIYDKKKT